MLGEGDGPPAPGNVYLGTYNLLSAVVDLTHFDLYLDLTS